MFQPHLCAQAVCSLTLTKLVVLKDLEKEIISLVISVGIKDSNCILSSDQILLSPRGLVKTDLVLTFSLQYSHSPKREGNKLQIMLQQKQCLKARTSQGIRCSLWAPLTGLRRCSKPPRMANF